MPVIPASGGRYLVAKYGHQCLYARIDRFDIYFLLSMNNARDIDDLLKLDDVVGVEVYQSTRDVPSEWRGDAMAPPVNEILKVPMDGTVITMGRIGLGFNHPSGGVPFPFGKTAMCPFLQIWTNLAW